MKEQRKPSALKMDRRQDTYIFQQVGVLSLYTSTHTYLTSRLHFQKG